MQYQLELLSEIRSRVKQLQGRCIPEHEVENDVISQLEQVHALFLNNDNVISPENIRDLHKRINEVLNYDVNSFIVSFLDVNNEIGFSNVIRDGDVLVGTRCLYEATEYKKILELIISISDFSDLEFKKVKLSLNQNELGVLIKLFTKCNFLAEKRTQKNLAKNFSLIFSTIEAEDLSAESLEKSAASLDISAFGKIKEKMSLEFESLRPIIKRLT